jgi:hypothetical protein
MIMVAGKKYRTPVLAGKDRNASVASSRMTSWMAKLNNAPPTADSG